MKNHKLLIANIAAAATLAAATLSTQAQTWQALLPSPTYGPAFGGNSVLIDPFSDQANPSVFVGYQSSTSGSATVLRLSPNDPLSFSFSIAEVDSGLASVTRVAHNLGDALYAVGYGPKDSKGRTVDIWKVRKSHDQNKGDANTWFEDDRFFFSKGGFSRSTGVTTDTSGNVYVSGIANDGRAPHWVVRRKVPGGVWTTVCDVKGQDNSMVPAMCFYPGNANNPTPAVFTVSDLNSKWTVLRSQNQGMTWASVDSWPGGNVEASAYDAACDSQGNIYVVGCRGLNGKNPSAWVVRRSQQGGNVGTWEPLLDAPGAGSWAFRVAIDGGGNVSVSGVIQDSTGTPRWAVVRNSPGQLWSDSWASRILPFGAATPSKGRGLAADVAGNLFLTGDVADWTDSEGNSYPGGRVGLLRMVP